MQSEVNYASAERLPTCDYFHLQSLLSSFLTIVRGTPHQPLLEEQRGNSWLQSRVGGMRGRMAGSVLLLQVRQSKRGHRVLEQGGAHGHGCLHTTQAGHRVCRHPGCSKTQPSRSITGLTAPQQTPGGQVTFGGN